MTSFLWKKMPERDAQSVVHTLRQALGLLFFLGSSVEKSKLIIAEALIFRSRRP